MNGRALLLVLLVAASLCLDLTFVFAMPIHDTKLMRVALAASQISLLAMWVAYGESHYRRRLPLAAAGIATWTWILHEKMSPGYHPWIVPCLVQALIITIPLFAAQLFGVRVVDSSKQPVHTRRKWQFSLSQILIWTLVVAMIMAALNAAELSRFSGQVLREGVVIGLAFAATGILSLWAALGSQHLALRIVGLPIGLVIVAAFLIREVLGPSEAEDVVVLLLIALLTVGSLVVVRLSGYRLARVSASGQHDAGDQLKT